MNENLTTDLVYIRDYYQLSSTACPEPVPNRGWTILSALYLLLGLTDGGGIDKETWQNLALGFWDTAGLTSLNRS
jgi:hypothetical protein